MRHRYVDVVSDARITIDSDIQAAAVNIAMVSGYAPVAIDALVFEYKSRSFDLPTHLHGLIRFGARRQAFSKYLACYQAVTRMAPLILCLHNSRTSSADPAPRRCSRLACCRFSCCW